MPFPWENDAAGGGAPTITFNDTAVHEEGDFLAGGIAGYVCLPREMYDKTISIINCGNRGSVSSKSGPAAGIAAYQKGSATEIVNVWNTRQVEGTLEADNVTGTWISGDRENCLDGRESTPEELCEKLNQWIASADMEEHFTLDGFDELYLWKVENGSLELVIKEKPEVSSEPEVITEPPEPTGNGRGDKMPSAEPTGSAVPVAPDGGSQTIQPDKKTGISPDSAAEPKATESAENVGMQTGKLQVKTQNDKKSGKQTKAKASAKKKTVPVFTLTRKKNKKGQRYIQLRVKKEKEIILRYGQRSKILLIKN